MVLCANTSLAVPLPPTLWQPFQAAPTAGMSLPAGLVQCRHTRTHTRSYHRGCVYKPPHLTISNPRHGPKSNCLSTYSSHVMVAFLVWGCWALFASGPACVQTTCLGRMKCMFIQYVCVCGCGCMRALTSNKPFKLSDTYAPKRPMGLATDWFLSDASNHSASRPNNPAPLDHPSAVSRPIRSICINKLSMAHKVCVHRVLACVHVHRIYSCLRVA